MAPRKTAAMKAQEYGQAEPVLATDKVAESPVSTLKFSESQMNTINQFAAALLGSADLHRVMEQPDVFESRIKRVFDAAVLAMQFSERLSQEKV